MHEALKDLSKPFLTIIDSNCWWQRIQSWSHFHLTLICFTQLAKIVNFPTNTEIIGHETGINPEHRSQHKNRPHFLLFVPLSFFSTCDSISAKSETSYQPTDSLVLWKHGLHGPLSLMSPQLPHHSSLPFQTVNHLQVLVANLALMSPSKDGVVILSARNLNLGKFGTEETGESGKLLAAV